MKFQVSLLLLLVASAIADKKTDAKKSVQSKNGKRGVYDLGYGFDDYGYGDHGYGGLELAGHGPLAVAGAPVAVGVGHAAPIGYAAAAPAIAVGHGASIGYAAAGPAVAVGPAASIGYAAAAPAVAVGPAAIAVPPPRIHVTEGLIKTITIHKETHVPVPAPYPVTVEKHVPVPYKVAVPVPVDRPVPVEVPKPYPVHVEKPYPVAVDRPVPYPVKVPVHVPVAQPVPVGVPQPYPVHVEKHVPYPVAQPIVVKEPVPVVYKEHHASVYAPSYVPSGAIYGKAIAAPAVAYSSPVVSKLSYGEPLGYQHSSLAGLAYGLGHELSLGHHH